MHTQYKKLDIIFFFLLELENLVETKTNATYKVFKVAYEDNQFFF